MNVNVSVTCSPFIVSTCKSMNYVWKCFNGIGGYPNNCSNAGYNGNGKISLDEGIYNLNYYIFNNDTQITIQGHGNI